MRNLWIFISKYNAFFFFIIFFVISLVFVVRDNSYQRATVLTSSNKIIGDAYNKVSYFRNYLELRKVNDSLMAENAHLRNQLKSSFLTDTSLEKTVIDSVYKQQYTYIEAAIVNNSVHQKDNSLTINRGKLQGIEQGMGVISSTGVVGVVRNVSNNYSTVQSLLHSDTKISASVLPSNAYGSLVWGDNYDPQIAVLQDIPNHIKVKRGEKVVTSGYSFFPAGLPVGKVIGTDLKGGNNFLDIKVQLSTDFSTLQYVYVIKDLLSLEKQQVEDLSKKNE